MKNDRELADMCEKVPLLSTQLLKALLERVDKSAKKVMNMKEAADYMGCSVAYIRKLYKDGYLAVCKPMGTERDELEKPGKGKTARVFILREDLDTFMTMNRIPSKFEVEQKASDYVLSRLK